MADFINTADAIGDDELCDQIIMKTVTEYKDDTITSIGSRTFHNCTSLTSVETPNVTSIGQYTFNGCTSLTSVEVPNLTVLPQGAFAGCTSLKKLPMMSNITNINIDCLNGCPILVIDMPMIQSLGARALQGCQFRALVLRRTDKVVALDTYSCFWGTSMWPDSSAHTYVPKIMDDGTDGIAAYEAADVWKDNFVGCFRYIEDYTVDGTVTGEIREYCESLSLDATELTFTDANTQTLTATGKFGIYDGGITWRSSDHTVANVKNGVVTPVSDGTATITATCGDFSVTCTVTVNAGLEFADILAGVGFNTGYLNNSGAIGSTTSTSDTYTDKFLIGNLAGQSIQVQLIDVRNTAANSRICYYDENETSVGYTQASSANYGAVINSTVPENAVYAAISVNKSNGFSAIKIYQGDTLVAGLDYTT